MMNSVHNKFFNSKNFFSWPQHSYTMLLKVCSVSSKGKSQLTTSKGTVSLLLKYVMVTLGQVLLTVHAHKSGMTMCVVHMHIYYTNAHDANGV